MMFQCFTRHSWDLGPIECKSSRGRGRKKQLELLCCLGVGNSGRGKSVWKSYGNRYGPPGNWAGGERGKRSWKALSVPPFCLEQRSLPAQLGSVQQGWRFQLRSRTQLSSWPLLSYALVWKINGSF